jgi:hypothetical protein
VMKPPESHYFGSRVTVNTVAGFCPAIAGPGGAGGGGGLADGGFASSQVQGLKVAGVPSDRVTVEAIWSHDATSRSTRSCLPGS